MLASFWSREKSVATGVGNPMFGNAEKSPITVVSTYGKSGPSTRVRVLDWLRHTGVSADIYDYVGTRDLSPRSLLAQPVALATAEYKIRKLARSSSDVLILSRRASPFGTGRLEKALLSNARHSIYDFDDALWGRPSSLKQSIGDDGAKWRRSVRSADVVIAGSPYLAESAVSAGARDVREIPSCVEVSDYSVRKEFEFIDSAPTILWFGSPSTEVYLRAVEEPLRRICEMYGARVVAVSAGSGDLGALDPFTTRVDWTPRLATQLATLGDIAIAPLEDTELARGKCAYKVLQYAAAGLPIVGSPVGANSPALQMFDALSPTRVDDWFDALREVIDESACRRQSRGRVARAAVEQNYSFERWAPNWVNAVQV